MYKILLLSLALLSCSFDNENSYSGISTTPNFSKAKVVNQAGKGVQNCNVILCSSQGSAGLAKNLTTITGADIIIPIDTVQTDTDGYFSFDETAYDKRTTSFSITSGDSLVCYKKGLDENSIYQLNKATTFKNNLDTSYTNKFDGSRYFAMIEGMPYFAEVINGAYDFPIVPDGEHNISIVKYDGFKYVIDVNITININITVNITLDTVYISESLPTIDTDSLIPVDTVATKDTVSTIDTTKIEEFDTATISDNVDSSLIAYWSFDNETSKDEMGTYNGTNFGNIKYVDGINGKAAYFDGSSYINVGDVEFNTSEVTFAVWVKPASKTGKILSKNGGNSANSDINITLELDGQYDGGFSIDDIEYDFTYGMGGNDYIGLAYPLDDQYDYLVVTYDGSNLIYYINGEEKANIAATGEISNGAHNLVFGAWTMDTSQELFTGIMDEITIYNKALSPNEIAVNYAKLQTGALTIIL